VIIISSKTPKLKDIIKRHLQKVAYIRKEIPNPLADFGIEFKFPTKKDFTMVIAKPKDKGEIQLTHTIKFGEEHLKRYNTLKSLEQNQLLYDLSQLVHSKECNFTILKFDNNERIIGIANKFILSGKPIEINKLFKFINKAFCVSALVLNHIKFRLSANGYTPESSSNLSPSYFT